MDTFSATIGVLSFQGDFERHAAMLKKLGAKVRLVRSTDDLNFVQGIIIPGGESTTIGKLLKSFGVYEPLKKRIESGTPVFGTCAGMILLANPVSAKNEHRLGVLDFDVERNAYGRQIESFETDIEVPAVNGSPFRGVFIRAPIVRHCGNGIEVLARFEENPVLIKKDKILAASFHPELTDDTRIHEYFLSMIS